MPGRRLPLVLLAVCVAASPWTATALAGAGADTVAAAPPSATPVAAVPNIPPGAPLAPALPMGAPQAGWRALSRTLASRGVTTNATLTGIWIGDVAGGVKTGVTAQSLVYGAVDADLGKLTGGWQGAHAFANVAFIRGGDLSGRFVGDALAASNLQAYASLRLYDAWIEQVFAGGRASLRFGSMGADEEFTGTDGGVMFTNSGFGWEAGIGANVVNGGPIYFVPALGARLEYRPGERWVLRAGAYDGDSFDSPGGDPVVNAHGLHFSLSRAQGAFLIGEGTRQWGARDGERAGRATLGAWRHTAAFPDDRLDARGAPFAVSGLDPAVHHGNQGGYGVLEQALWNSPAGAGAGIAGWVRLAGAPADRSAYTWVPEAGLRWTGLVPGRAGDALGLGWLCGIVSPALRQQVRDANAADGGTRPVPDHEAVFEAAYEFRFAGHWVVTPDVQWVQHPGATAATANATVAGLRLAWQ